MAQLLAPLFLYEESLKDFEVHQGGKIRDIVRLRLGMVRRGSREGVRRERVLLARARSRGTLCPWSLHPVGLLLHQDPSGPVLRALFRVDAGMRRVLVRERAGQDPGQLPARALALRKAGGFLRFLDRV